jgi:hypothetical protein
VREVEAYKILPPTHTDNIGLRLAGAGIKPAAVLEKLATTGGSPSFLPVELAELDAQAAGGAGSMRGEGKMVAMVTADGLTSAEAGWAGIHPSLDPVAGDLKPHKALRKRQQIVNLRALVGLVVCERGLLASAFFAFSLSLSPSRFLSL